MQSNEGTSIDVLRAPTPVVSAGASTEVERAIAEVQAQMIIAKRYPRDTDIAWAKIQKACKRAGLAEAALYAYTKGGSEVSGPSIRLAEELARDWGNIAFGWKILQQDDDMSEVRAEAWDLETNVPAYIVFTVRHEFKSKGQIKKVTDPREVYELIANQASRRLRACVLRVIPGDVQDMAVEQCEKTLKDGSGKPLSDRVRDMLAAFLNEHGITKEMVETRLGKKIEAINETEFVTLARIYVSLRDGMAKVEQFFDVGPAGGTPTAKDLQAQGSAAPKKDEAKKPGPAAQQRTEKFTPGTQTMFTVVDALALVNKGDFDAARDLARGFSEDDKKKIEASIVARGGAAAQPAAAEQQAQEPGEPLPPARTEDLELVDVLKEFKDAKTLQDLTAAGVLIDDLPPEDQDTARRKWMERKSEFEAAPPARRAGRRGIE
jgi:hypothetical protein